MNKFLGVFFALGAFWVQPAVADPIFGAPSDELLGCDSAFGGSCKVFFDEDGHITASFHSFLQGDLKTTAAHVASRSDPTWVDSSGTPLQVTSYDLQVQDSLGGNDNGFAPFFSGAVGLCEFGAAADGSACTGPTGDDKSDVVLFNYSFVDHMLHIDFLSDHESVFNFRTDFNVLEIGSEFLNGADYRALGNSGGGEDVFYHIVSDIPEPATWAMMLVGFGLAGAVLRRKAVAAA